MLLHAALLSPPRSLGAKICGERCKANLHHIAHARSKQMDMAGTSPITFVVPLQDSGSTTLMCTRKKWVMLQHHPLALLSLLYTASANSDLVQFANHLQKTGKKQA